MGCSRQRHTSAREVFAPRYRFFENLFKAVIVLIVVAASCMPIRSAGTIDWPSLTSIVNLAASGKTFLGTNWGRTVDFESLPSNVSARDRFIILRDLG